MNSKELLHTVTDLEGIRLAEMIVVTVLVFLGVFTLVGALMFATGNTSTRQAKKVKATLDSALASETPEAQEENLDFRKRDDLSAMPWLNATLQKMDVAPRLRSLMSQAQVKWTTGALLLMSLVALAVPAYLVYRKSSSILFAVLCGLVCGAIPLGYVAMKRRQRFKKFEQGLPEALELMVGALRVGHSLSAAMSLVARECPEPIRGEFRICFDEQNFGLELRSSLENMTARVPLQDLKIAVTAILIQKESGGNLAEVLDKTAYVIRQRFRLRRQIMVHTAQGRMTGWILSIMPLGLGVILYFLSPKTIGLLWTTPIGVKLLYSAGGMLAVGSFIIQKIVNMEV
jgi:tight adherence protein B